MNRRSLKTASLLVLLALSSTGCALRVSRDEVVAALADGRQPQQPVGSPAPGSGSDVPIDETSGAGDEAAADGQPASGEPAGGADTAAGLPAASGIRPETAASAARPTVKSGATRASGAGSQLPGQGGSAKAPAGGAAAPATPKATPAGGSVAASPAAPKSPVVIANVGEYSGVIGATTKSTQTALAVWAKWVNDTGGLDGHPVRLLTASNDGDPNKYLAVVRDMVENKGAIAFVSNIVPITVSGADQYLRQKGVPVIGGDATAPLWSQSPMLFPQGTTFNPHLLAGIGQLIANTGKKKVAVFYCAEVDACKSYGDVYKTPEGKRTGVQVVYEAQVSIAQPDYTAECLQAKNRGAEAVIAAVDGSSIRRVARSCSQQGYRPQYASVGTALTQDAAVDPLLEGFVAPTAVFPWVADDTPAAREYQQVLARYAPDLPSGPFTAIAWTSASLLKAAAARLPAKPTAQDILNGLWAIKDNNLGGLAPKLTFLQGKPAPEFRCYFAVAIKGGKWTAPSGSAPICT